MLIIPFIYRGALKTPSRPIIIANGIYIINPAKKMAIISSHFFITAAATDANKAHTAPASTFTWTFEENSLKGANIAYENGNALYRADEVTGYPYSNLFSDGVNNTSGIGEVTDGYLHREDVNSVPTAAASTYS